MRFRAGTRTEAFYYLTAGTYQYVANAITGTFTNTNYATIGRLSTAGNNHVELIINNAYQTDPVTWSSRGCDGTTFYYSGGINTSTSSQQFDGFTIYSGLGRFSCYGYDNTA